MKVKKVKEARRTGFTAGQARGVLGLTLLLALVLGAIWVADGCRRGRGGDAPEVVVRVERDTLRDTVYRVRKSRRSPDSLKSKTPSSVSKANRKKKPQPPLPSPLEDANDR